MATKLEIANLALAEVAEAQLTALDASSEASRLCVLHLPFSVREVLREGMWKCARASATLVATTAPGFGWANAYTLPADFIRLVSFNDVDPDDVREELFEIRGATLETDHTEAKIVYVKDLSTADAGVALMDALVTRAVVLNLASKLAWPLQQSRTLQENLLGRYMEAVRKAKAVDARDERRPLVNRESSSNWFNARY
jgi:hypothetical protein